MIKMGPVWLSRILRALPNFLWPLKVYIIGRSFKKTGKKFHTGPSSTFSDHRLIEIGDYCFIGDGSNFSCEVPLYIGNYAMIGPQVMIISGDHNISVPGKKMREVKTGGVNLSIVIEDDVWIGSRTIILKGVKIGEGAVVGAGSLVTKSIPPYSINVGYPCKTIKCRFTSADLKTHLTAVQSKYGYKEIEEQYKQFNIKIND